MTKVINFLAVWILVFTLPVQGFAAVTMMNCEKSHSHEVKSLLSSHDHAVHSSYEHSSYEHSGDDEATNHEHVADAVDNHDTHHSTSTKHACSHCGTCNVCCSSTAIVSPSLNVASLFDNNKAKLAYIAPQFTSFVSAGLERPPRTILV
jgi:hypothetical protein